MKIAYIRVSTVEQNEERQIQALEKYNIEKWFSEKISAKDMNRPKLKEMLEFMREGDTVYIHDFSRLARTTKDLLTMVDLFANKKVELVSDKENIDSGTASGQLMLTVIAAMYEFERANMLERQKEGIAIAKAKGKYKGRKKIDFPSNWKEVYEKWSSREMKGVDAMKELGLKRNTFYKLVSDYKKSLQSKS